MTPSQRIYHVPHTWHNELIWWYLTQRTQTRHRHENQWAFTGISPSNQSEEAHPSMTIDEHQNGNSMDNKSHKMFDILHRRPGPHGISNQTSPLWEQTWTSVQETYDALRNKHAHTSHKGGFIFPCIPFYLFISTICWQKLCITNVGTDTGTHQQRKIPIFSFYITATLGLPFHNL